MYLLITGRDHTQPNPITLYRILNGDNAFRILQPNNLPKDSLDSLIFIYNNMGFFPLWNFKKLKSRLKPFNDFVYPNTESHQLYRAFSLREERVTLHEKNFIKACETRIDQLIKNSRSGNWCDEDKNTDQPLPSNQHRWTVGYKP
jgi:hypothetical protein